MIITEELVKQSQQRLSFDPKELSQLLKHKRPIDNESPERVKVRLAVAEAQGPDALERFINGNDLVGINYLERGVRVSQAVGRIHKLHPSTGDLLDYATGFLISPNLLLTNNHVFTGLEDTLRSQIEFNYQKDKDGFQLGSELYSFLPDQFFYTDKDLDFTVVAVENNAYASGKPLTSFGWLPLNPQIGKVSPGESLTIIQHPGGGVKQIALRENKLLRIDPNVVWYITDTARGSSGSPVFNDSWQVIALHHSGIPATKDGHYLTIDGEIWSGQIDDSKINWIANEGIRVSRIVKSIQSAYGDHHVIQGIFAPAVATVSSVPQTQLNSQLKEIPMSPTSSSEPTSSKQLNGRETTKLTTSHSVHVSASVGMEEVVRLTVPLTITIQLGNASGAPLPEPLNGAPGIEEAVSIDPNYRSRTGYTAEFLGTGSKRIPLPQLSPQMRKLCAVNTQATPGTDETVLPYHHFSIVMNGERKLAFHTAVNIDGQVSYRLKRDKDAWIRDPRIAPDEQTDEFLYKKNDLDRGHLVRRLDPAWGSTEAIARIANDDTFHFTNCSPQHHDFNTSNATWQGLENYILDNAIAEDLKVTVFTGPVLRDDDESFQGVQLPRQFWKVLAMVKDGKLSATGYLLSQAELIEDLGNEAFSNDRLVKNFQVPIRQIEKLTGLGFSLSNFDPLDRVESTQAAISITSYDRIQF